MVNFQSEFPVEYSSEDRKSICETSGVPDGIVGVETENVLRERFSLYRQMEIAAAKVLYRG